MDDLDCAAKSPTTDAVGQALRPHLVEFDGDDLGNMRRAGERQRTATCAEVDDEVGLAKVESTDDPPNGVRVGEEILSVATAPLISRRAPPRRGPCHGG
jgi:hypothetical protein